MGPAKAREGSFGMRFRGLRGQGPDVDLRDDTRSAPDGV